MSLESFPPPILTTESGDSPALQVPTANPSTVGTDISQKVTQLVFELDHSIVTCTSSQFELERELLKVHHELDSSSRELAFPSLNGFIGRLANIKKRSLLLQRKLGTVKDRLSRLHAIVGK